MQPENAANSVAPLPTSSESMMKIRKGSHKFVINGYSHAKDMGVGQHIESDTFKVGGFEFAIQFYPDGHSATNNSTHVSVFIVLASEGTKVRAMYELKLLDQSGNGKHKVNNAFPFTFEKRGSLWGYKHYLERTTLEASDYLKDDCLKFDCTIGVVVSVLGSPRKFSIFVPESNFGKYFGALFDNKESADVVFDVAGEKFHAHKFVLAARSPIFHAQIERNEISNIKRIRKKEKNEISLADMEPKVFKAMLHFIYQDILFEDDHMELDTHVSETLAAKVLNAADKYGLERLRLLCEARLCKDISLDKVASILLLADRYHAMKLKDACLQFIVENLAGVLQSSVCEHLKDNPSVLLELLKLIASWIPRGTCL